MYIYISVLPARYDDDNDSLKPFIFKTHTTIYTR